MLDAMCIRMHEHSYAPKSKHLFLDALKGVLRETLPENLISDAHILRARSSIPAVDGRVLKSGPVGAETQIMLSSCDEDFRHQGPRDAAIISLILDCAISPREIAALEVGSVDLNVGTICFLRKKQMLVLELSASTITRLRKWISLRNKEIGEYGVLFNRIRKGSKSTLVWPSNNDSEPVFAGDIQVSGLTQVAIRQAIKSRSAQCERSINSASLQNSSPRSKKKHVSSEELRNAVRQLDF
jgi:integrase